MQREHQIILLAVVAVTALAALLCGDGFLSLPSYERDDHRSLRYSQFRNPNSPLVKANLNTTLNIYLTGDASNPAYSIFETDIIQRYSSGRLDYKIHLYAACDDTCSNPVIQDGMAPCLAVTRNVDKKCKNEHLHCTYPKCRTMVTNDEKCIQPWFEVREYYSSAIPNTGYLPLGPRLDSWRSFQKAQSETNFFVKSSSQRRYAFNAVFSKDTNKVRGQLAYHIENQREKNADKLEIYTKMASKWTSHVNSRWSEQLSTDEYVQVALDSVFTLSPAGHNPECFRLFEAVETGTIPIVSKSDMKSYNSHCKESLHDWYESPILVLTSWYDLFPTVRKLMEDKDKLDQMQVKLRLWYDDYMKTVVGEFEDFMVDTYVKEKADVAWQ